MIRNNWTAVGTGSDHAPMRETVQDYLQRGGTITVLPPRRSRYLADDASVLILARAGTIDDVLRGFAPRDIPLACRQSLQERTADTHETERNREM